MALAEKLHHSAQSGGAARRHSSPGDAGGSPRPWWRSGSRRCFGRLRRAPDSFGEGGGEEEGEGAGVGEKTIFSQAASSSGSSGLLKEKEVDELCTLRVSLAQLCGNDWKQSRQGEAKHLMHCSSGEVWFVMRDEQSMKIIAQFHVNDDCDLYTTDSSGRSLFCSPTVVSDGERSHVFYTLRFASKELALKFKGAFDEAKVWQRGGPG